MVLYSTVQTLGLQEKMEWLEKWQLFSPALYYLGQAGHWIEKNRVPSVPENFLYYF